MLGLAIGGYLLYSKFTYVYASGLSVLGLAIGGYLLYSKFKKQKQNLIDVPPPPMLKASTEPKRDIFEML